MATVVYVSAVISISGGGLSVVLDIDVKWNFGPTWGHILASVDVLEAYGMFCSLITLISRRNYFTIYYARNVKTNREKFHDSCPSTLIQNRSQPVHDETWERYGWSQRNHGGREHRIDGRSGAHFTNMV